MTDSVPPQAIPGLTEGRIVRFVPGPHFPIQFFNNNFPAIIQEVRDHAAGVVDLVVFGKDPFPARSMLDVAFDPSDQPAGNTWHFTPEA